MVAIFATRWPLVMVGLISLAILPNVTFGRAETTEQDEVTFVGSATYRPFQWIDQGGQPKGFVLDIQESLAQHGDKVAEHYLMTWEDAISSVLNGDADVIPLLASEDRRQNFDFTEPFYYLAHGIFSNEDARYGTLLELSGKKVAVVKGSYASMRLAEEYENIELVKIETERECLVAVQEYKAVACIEVIKTSRRYAEESQVEQTSVPFWPQPYVFAVRKGNIEQLDWLNAQLGIIQSNGTYHQIYHDWLPELEWHKHHVSDWFRYFIWILFPLALFSLAGFGVSWYLKRQVSLRTRQLTGELDARRELEEKLRYKADYDDLTGLPSRAAFIDELEQRLNVSPDWSPIVILFRLLNLEQLTSMFGYHLGHELLLEGFSHRLESMGFEEVSHFGSGVFAVVRKHDMPHQDVFDYVSESFEIETFTISAQVVLGISEGRAGGEHKSLSEAEELVRRAMTAYSAAARAAGPWRVYSQVLEPDPRDLILIEHFRRFGTRDMFLLYQPKLDLKSGYVHEAEALVRWQHPTLGLVSPGHFVTLLEQTGLVNRLTYWVLEEAMLEVERCRRYDSGFSISVNVSARDFLDGFALVDFILSKKSCWHPHGLCLELTETGVIQDHDQAQKVVTAIHEAKISSAIDDFGTGYSSLSYLSKFQVDEVKLDRSFICSMMESEKDRAIIASTIDLAHKMGLKVTAEGVEDVETLQTLAEMGCDTAQGYLISRPIPVAELYQLMSKMHPLKHSIEPWGAKER